MQKLLRINYLTFFILLLTLGINVLIFNEKLYKLTIIIILVVLLIDTLRQFVKLIVKREITFVNSLGILGSLIAILIMLNYKNIPYSFFPIVLGAYAILNGIVKFVYSIILFANKMRGRLVNLLLSLLFFTVGIILIFSPIIHLKQALYFMGAYLILLSINYLYEYYKDVKHIEKNNLRRSLRVPLPSIIEAFLPYAFLKQIDDNVKLYENKTNEKPDLEILIHVTETGDGRMGHIDLYYDNTVYSYGNYDPATRKFHMVVGDGVLLKSKKKKYIEFCIKEANKTLFCYGIKLNKEQNEAIKKELDKINNNLVKHVPNWDPKAYAERIEKYTNAKFFKFKKGKFKKYILLGSNCAHFIDSILGKTGSDILKINGLINPGTYYEYLENEFNKKNSNVISRAIYNKSNINNL